MTSDIIVLIILLFLSGFFSAATTAFFSISRTKAVHLSRSGERIYLLIWQMKAQPHKLLTTLLICNTLVNISASVLATALALKTVPHGAIGVAIGVMTLSILVFGEILPKSIATQNNVLVARLAVYPIYWLSIVLFPLIKILNFIPQITQKIHPPASMSEEELLTYVELVEEEGEIKEAEKELIHNIFRFDDTNCSEIMTPRADMFVIDINTPLDLKAIIDSGFTRIPVIDDDMDHVVGVINIKDLFSRQSLCSEPMDIREIMREPYFVPENKKLDSLLRQFKKRKNHIAVVIDEHGGVSGLISLEDVLEEIVGEISDETDLDEPHIVRIKPHEWIVLGKAEIDKVNETIPMDIPDSPEYDTFSGFILSRIGRIPHENEEIAMTPFTIVVKEMDGNRIKKYIVRQSADPSFQSQPPAA